MFELAGNGFLLPVKFARFWCFSSLSVKYWYAVMETNEKNKIEQRGRKYTIKSERLRVVTQSVGTKCYSL